MRILLDECLPRPLAGLLPGHEVTTVQEAGWAGRTNGELLSLIAGRYDVFVTVDRNLLFQQKVEGLAFGVVVLQAPSNRVADLKTLVPMLLSQLETINPGQIVHIAA